MAEQVHQIVQEVPLGLLSLKPITDDVSLVCKLEDPTLSLYVRHFEINKDYSLMDGSEEGQAEVLQYLMDFGRINQDQRCQFHHVTHVVVEGRWGSRQLIKLPLSQQFFSCSLDETWTYVDINSFPLRVMVRESTGELSSFTEHPNLIGFFIAGLRRNSIHSLQAK